MLVWCRPLLGSSYTANQMTYDLRHLRRRGLIVWVAGTHRYLVTPLGLRFSYFYTKLNQRILKPAWAALLPAPPVPSPLRTAIRVLDRHFEHS
jgi:hypothetical protein